MQQLQAFECTDFEAIYWAILSSCQAWTGDIPSTFTAARLPALVPRPAAPAGGVALGNLTGD